MDDTGAIMNYQKCLASLAVGLALLPASKALAADPVNDPMPTHKKELSYPVGPRDREALMKRVASLEKGMTVKEALAALQPMRGFPKPVWDIPGNNSFAQDIGGGWSLRLNFASAAEGGLLVAAKINPPVKQQKAPGPKQ
jgi:hypothetical protein